MAKRTIRDIERELENPVLPGVDEVPGKEDLVRYARDTGDLDKPKVKEVQKWVLNNETGKEFSYDEYLHSTDFGEISGLKEISVEDAIELIANKYGIEKGEEAISSVEGEDYKEDVLEDFCQEELKASADNTYNYNWFGPIVNFTILQTGNTNDRTYNEGIVFVRMHRGGDVRGNYTDTKIYRYDSEAEDMPWYVASLVIDIITDQGTDVFSNDGMEGYSLYCNSSETGVVESDDTYNVPDLESDEYYNWEDAPSKID